ncbi:DUF2569 domain-containing protein [Paenibacillus soyae]|uniref:DUF2569 domain-containing protein n=1 Tax=Paenibacillus soyae TaxID=2969249 RepID=A0A9X2SC42_9BACL|nr:DUF2569 domain-containing protein [Paenibacillus soyae]MCR2807861.1 DUF2569 domain-containing protein [Paenibacillus soyae]
MLQTANYKKDVLTLEASLQEEKKYDTLPLGVSGFGGWLILVQIGLYITLIGGFISIFTTFIPSFQPEVWEVFATPGSEWYHPLWGPLLIFETAYGLLTLLAVIILFTCFYMRKSFVPRFFIILYAGNLLLTVVDSVLMQIIDRETGVLGGDTGIYTDIVRSAITCAIWIPYFLKSERVANTFIR